MKNVPSRPLSLLIVYYCLQSQNSMNHILGTNYQKKKLSVLLYCSLKASCLPLLFIKIHLRLFICICVFTAAVSPSLFILNWIYAFTNPCFFCYILSQWLFMSYIKQLDFPCCGKVHINLPFHEKSKNFCSHYLFIVLYNIVSGRTWQWNYKKKKEKELRLTPTVSLCFNTMIHRQWTHTQVWCKILCNTVPSIAVSSNKKINRKNSYLKQIWHIWDVLLFSWCSCFLSMLIRF